MRPSLMGNTFVPSPAVLKYLKGQAECLRLIPSLSASKVAGVAARCSANSVRQLHSSTKSSSFEARLCRNGLRLSPCTSSRSRRLQYAYPPKFQNARLASTSSPRWDISAGARAIASRSAQTRARLTAGSRASSWMPWQKAPKSSDPPELQPNDLPSFTGSAEDGASLGRIIKPTNELKLRCTEFDENGNVTLVNGEFKKSELIQKVRGKNEGSCRHGTDV